MARVTNTPRLREPKPEPQAKPRHVGGGVYELPDGRRVKGKAAALKAMGE